MKDLKIRYKKNSRQIIITYSIINRKEDKRICMHIFGIALDDKLSITTYVDNFETRCFILKGKNTEQLEKTYKHIEKLK